MTIELCTICGVQFEDRYGDLFPDARRIYCNKCVDRLWEEANGKPIQ